MPKATKRRRRGGGEGHPHSNDRDLTGRKHKSNLFYWQRKERTPPSFFSRSSPRHHPNSPTQQLFLSLSALPPTHPAAPHARLSSPPSSPWVWWLCFIVVQRSAGKPPSGLRQGSGCPWMLECSSADAPMSRGLGGMAGHLVSKWALWPFKPFVLTHFEHVLHMRTFTRKLNSCVHICRWSKL